MNIRNADNWDVVNIIKLISKLYYPNRKADYYIILDILDSLRKYLMYPVNIIPDKLFDVFWNDFAEKNKFKNNVFMFNEDMTRFCLYPKNNY